MSRTGSFPLELAVGLIESHAAAGSVVLDPFCGKGTTLLAARLLGGFAAGMDVGPDAVFGAVAKMLQVDVDDVVHAADGAAQAQRLGS